MPALDRLLVAVMAVAAAVALAGLVKKYRANACWSFGAYLGATAAIDAALAAQPSRFWNWEFLLGSDVVQTTLGVACAFEVTFRTFRPLPAGHAKARRALLILAVVMAALVAAYPGPTARAFDWTLVVARVTYGVAFLFAVYLGLTAYYHVPVDPVHRDVAHGFVLLSLLVAFTHPLARLDPIMGWGRDFVVKFSYPLLLAWWARRAWAPEEPTALSREVMQAVQPWRVKRVHWS
jgi:hypothetical protein